MNEVELSIRKLREAAIAEGFQESAIAYGWSAIRLAAARNEKLAAEIKAKYG